MFLKSLWSLPLAATLIFGNVPVAFAGGHSTPSVSDRAADADESADPAGSTAPKTVKHGRGKAKGQKTGRKARKGKKVRRTKKASKGLKTRRHGKPGVKRGMPQPQ